jgi:hypothetical protein
MGTAERDGNVVHAGHLDRMVHQVRVNKPLDSTGLEVNDDAHGDRLWLLVFQVLVPDRRRALARQRQGLVRRPYRRRQSGDHRSESDDARASSKHLGAQSVEHSCGACLDRAPLEGQALIAADRRQRLSEQCHPSIEDVLEDRRQGPLVAVFLRDDDLLGPAVLAFTEAQLSKAGADRDDVT